MNNSGVVFVGTEIPVSSAEPHTHTLQNTCITGDGFGKTTEQYSSHLPSSRLKSMLSGARTKYFATGRVLAFLKPASSSQRYKGRVGG